MQSEPVVEPSISAYSGVYEVPGLEYVITIRVGRDGTIQADGYERRWQRRTFELENARIDGAVLTATRVYQDGAVERFEGVFLKRTERDSATDPGTTTLGLGVMLTTPVEFEGVTFDKLFYQLKE